jgi:hypothetical protein
MVFKIVGLLAVALMASAMASIEDIDAQVKSVLPTPTEDKWLSIPWRLNLIEARKESAETKKPMFVWMMNGHPMGCT